MPLCIVVPYACSSCSRQLNHQLSGIKISWTLGVLQPNAVVVVVNMCGTYDVGRCLYSPLAEEDTEMDRAANQGYIGGRVPVFMFPSPGLSNEPISAAEKRDIDSHNGRKPVFMDASSLVWHTYYSSDCVGSRSEAGQSSGRMAVSYHVGVNAGPVPQPWSAMV